MTTSPSFSQERIVDFPVASRPTIKVSVGVLETKREQSFENIDPMVLARKGGRTAHSDSGSQEWGFLNEA